MAKLEREAHTRDNPLPVDAKVQDQAGFKILVAEHCGNTYAIPHPEEHEGEDLAHCPRCKNVLKLVPKA